MKVFGTRFSDTSLRPISTKVKNLHPSWIKLMTRSSSHCISKPYPPIHLPRPLLSPSRLTFMFLDVSDDGSFAKGQFVRPPLGVVIECSHSHWFLFVIVEREVDRVVVDRILIWILCTVILVCVCECSLILCRHYQQFVAYYLVQSENLLEKIFLANFATSTSRW